MNGQKYAIPFPLFLAVSVGMIVMSLLFYVQFHENQSLPKLPALTTSSGSADSRSSAPTASAMPESLYYPYYYGAPVYSYQYDLQTQFPSLGGETMVYTITAKKYDRAAAVVLASRFGLTGDPIEPEGSFVFSDGTTPITDVNRSSTGSGSSGPGITGIPSQEKSTIEPSEPTTVVDPATLVPKPEPTTAETFTGHQLTVTTDGSISYYDYSAVRTTVTVSPDDAETKVGTQTPDGVADKDAAISFAVNYLRTVGLLPAAYEATAGDPYGSYSVVVTPKHNGYAISSGAITVEVANQGTVASLYLRDIVVADFHPYPTKSASETLALQPLTYRIEEVTLTYASSYDENGVEYAQPVYVLSGTDSQGTDFSFEIPAVKAEFLQSPQIMPLRAADAGL